MENKVKRMKEIINKHYRNLEKLPKPSKHTIGGTYYGSTELLSSVGNHLEIDENCYHISYGYGTNTKYKNAYVIRIGGAYKYPKSDIIKELKEVFGGMYDQETKVGIIEDYGTNYSVIGFGTIYR